MSYNWYRYPDNADFKNIGILIKKELEREQKEFDEQRRKDMYIGYKELEKYGLLHEYLLALPNVGRRVKG